MTGSGNFRLERLEVWGLFKRLHYVIEIQDNCLIMVGENGSGKSTVLSILNLLLTRQWGRLAAVPFEKLALRLNGEELVLDRSLLHTSGLWRIAELQIESQPRHVPRPHLRPSSLSFQESLSRHLSDVDIEEVLEELGHGKLTSLQVDEVFRILEKSRGREPSPELIQVSERLENAVACQVLFLPTYRRIEHDLRTIFPGLNMDSELRKRRMRPDSQANEGYVELVEFGMKDVEDVFRSVMQRLDKEFRSDLNDLTGEYLRDIIRSDFDQEDEAELLQPGTPAIVSNILGRIDDRILPQAERTKLESLINQVQEDRIIDHEDRFVLHFVSKLMRMHAAQIQREERVAALVTVCNEYLSGKSLKFDQSQFEISLILDAQAGAKGVSLPAKGLSSGEKQIVSLFTHIYLSDQNGFFVIIDEPELSISVPWQRRFLEDIWESGLCEGLVAVTHSPFIFENNLARYAHSMSEFQR